MMGHRQVEQAALFYEFSLEKHVPADHLLRSIDSFVELGELRRALEDVGSRADRPPIRSVLPASQEREWPDRTSLSLEQQFEAKLPGPGSALRIMTRNDATIFI